MDSVLGFEWSPLSCHSMAEKITTNEYGLFGSLDEAISGATRFSIEQPVRVPEILTPEPGDYYVVGAGGPATRLGVI